MTRRIAKMKILLVEDDPATMKVLSIFLKNAGFEVHQANHALPALFALVRFDPDLVLADISMPKMSGIELLRQIKGHDETSKIPVVVMSGYTTPENHEAAMVAGCVAFLTK